MVDKNIEENNDVLLSKDEVWDVLQFARALSGQYISLLTPDLVHRRMQDISFKPIGPTKDQLDNALSDPKDSEDALRSFVESFEIVSMPFKRILSYMSSLLALDFTYSVTNVTQPNEYNKPIFKKDQEKVYDFLDHFDHKGVFRNVTKQVLRNELYVGSVRQDGRNIILQELPIDFCKITGRWDYGLLVSFNFYYFLLPGIDIELYHPFFRKKFLDVFGSMEQAKYNPHLGVSERGSSQYVYWVDLPPDVAWAFKLDTSLITAIPFFSGLMPDLIDQGIMRSLQKNVNMATASKMLLGEVPMIKDSKAGSLRDMIAVDPVTLGKFLNLVKSSMSDSIKMASAPLENMKAISFESDNELYDQYLRTALASSGMNTSLIFSSQLKANVIDSQLSFEADSKIMEQQLYPQFNAFFNYWINKELRKYIYAFEFEGNDFYLNRDSRFEKSMTMADKGIVLPQKIAAAIGVKPQTLYRWIEEAKAIGFVDQLTPIISAFQMSPDAGRPKKDDSKLNDEGANTRGSGGNIAKKDTA